MKRFFLKFIEQSVQNYQAGKALNCAIIYQNSLNKESDSQEIHAHDLVVGNISFNSIDHSLKKVIMGYWLRQDYQGKGIVSKALLTLIEYAFTELDMQKIEIHVATGNQASRNVCERLGFKLEGIITRAENINGQILDHALYALHKNN